MKYYNNCNECPYQKECPMATMPVDYKRKVCAFWRLQGNEDHKSKSKVRQSKERINEIYKQLFDQPMDYNRNDTHTIVKNFDPNLN